LPLTVVGMNSIAAYLLVDIQHAAPFVRTALSPVVTPAREALERRLEERLQGESEGPLVIQSAEYGVPRDPDARADVTAAVARAVGGNSLRLEITNDLLDGIDPAPGRDKCLTVSYTVAGQPRRATAPEYATLTLPPAPAAAGVPAQRLPPAFAALCEIPALRLAPPPAPPPAAAGVLAKRLPPLFAAVCEFLAIWLILLWLHRRRIYLKI